MNNQKNNTQPDAPQSKLPFFVEFVKFASGFAVIVALALFVLHVVNVFFR